MEVFDGVEVEECYHCGAPDPKGIRHTENAGPNRGKTFFWCRTCWKTGATSFELYLTQYDGSASLVSKIVCRIEQERLLREEEADAPTRALLMDVYNTFVLMGEIPVEMPDHLKVQVEERMARLQKRLNP